MGLKVVHIDPSRPQESIQHRWCCMRWTTQGTTQYWVSPLFARDFATADEIGQVYAENRMDKEVIDMWVPKSDKAILGQDIINHLFLHKKTEYVVVCNKDTLSCFQTGYNIRIRLDSGRYHCNVE